MPRLTAPSSTHSFASILHTPKITSAHTRTRASERKPRPSAGGKGVGGGRGQCDFGDRILAIIYASRAYGFRLYGAYECLSAKINGQFVRAHCRR